MSSYIQQDPLFRIEDEEDSRCKCPSFVDSFLTSIVGGTFILIPAIIVILIGPFKDYYPLFYTKWFGESWKFEIFRWSSIIGTSFITYYMALAIIGIFPIFFNILDSMDERQKDERIENFFIKRLYMLRRNIAWLATSIVLYLMVELMFFNAQRLTSNIEKYLVRGALGFVVLAVTLLLKGLLLQKISIDYQGKFLNDRIDDNRIAFECIQRLKKIFPSSIISPSGSRGRRKSTTAMDGTSGPTTTGARAGASSPTGERRLSSSSPFSISSTSSANLGSTHVNDIAERLFSGLCPYPRDTMILKDVREHISDPETAQRFFYILDRNDHGDVTRREFYQAIQLIYDERADLNNSLTQNCKVLDQMDWILLYLCVGLLIFFNLSIFDLSDMSLLATYGGVGILIRFLFGNMAADAFKAAVFVLIIHPFDVGDSIQVNGKSLRVKEIGLWSTSFIGDQNRLVYYQNKDLISATIGNNRRSTHQTEPIKVLLSSKVKNSQLIQFEERINDFVKRHSRDFAGHVAFKNVALLNVDCMSIEFDIPHRSNFQITLQKELRSNIFMMNFNELAQKENIHYGPYNWDPQIKLLV